jgi:hypothetical protein
VEYQLKSIDIKDYLTEKNLDKESNFNKIIFIDQTITDSIVKLVLKTSNIEYILLSVLIIYEDNKK